MIEVEKNHEWASKGVAGAGLGLGIAGTALGLLNGGIPGLLDQGSCGMLIDNDDASIAEAMKVLVLDQNLRKSLGQKGKERSVLFSSKSMAEQYCEIYK